MTTPLDYRVLVKEEQRLAILQTLHAAPDYLLPEPLLRQALAGRGHPLAADTLVAHLAWLEERPDAPVIRLAGEQVRLVRLTLRGEDLALGRTREPGIARPAP